MGGYATRPQARSRRGLGSRQGGVALHLTSPCIRSPLPPRVPLASLHVLFARMSAAPSILFVNQHYWPDFASTGQHLTDLAEHLAAEGFDVHVLCASGRYTAGAVEAPRREKRNGVSIRRLRTTGFGRGSHLGRLIDYGSFYAQVMRHFLFGSRYDLVITLTTPPLLSAAAAMGRRLKGQRYAVWSMDLHPDAEFALGMLSPSGPVGRTLEALNAYAYRTADFVVELGACMRERLLAKGVEADALHRIPVWSRKDEIEPLAPEDNPLRERLGLENQFVVMYSGNAGLAHCFEEVVEAAERLKEHDDITFLFVGNGPRREAIEAAAEERGLRNLRYLDYFPREDLRYSLPLGDVHLLTLRESFAGIAVPGKLYGIMAAGRPLLMVGPEESEPAQVIRREGIGKVVRPGVPGSAKALAEAISTLRNNPRKTWALGRRAHEVFLDHFEQEAVCRRWAHVLRDELGRLPRGREGARKKISGDHIQRAV